MGNEGPQPFNQEQYDLLLACSVKGDFTEWNTWYEEYIQ
jgi:hypothetical protein